MGWNAFVEPLVVVTLLFGGAWVNRNTGYDMRPSTPDWHRPSRRAGRGRRDESPDSLESGLESPEPTDSLIGHGRPESPSLLPSTEAPRRTRELRILGCRREVVSPNTAVFRNRLSSRLLKKFPFLVEAWYWALIYWVYQIGRAVTALTLVEGTVNVARQHALQLIHLEELLHIFCEADIQRRFLEHPALMHWINRIYSFIHIPGTILFLVWLFHYTTTRGGACEPRLDRDVGEQAGRRGGPALYQARRRTMAMCNLIAFIIFTTWPCMPPRLLSDPDVEGPVGDEARKYGFVDTVHSGDGESSVWTTNRFCNQYAAMPSLHFGYSLLIGLTVMTIPLAPGRRRSRSIRIGAGSRWSLRLRFPSLRRILCVVVGVAYPLTILTAIIATANHFILDAVAGAMVCGLAWFGNAVLLNLLPIEDYFLWAVRIHKPDVGPAEAVRDEDFEYAKPVRQ